MNHRPARIDWVSLITWSVMFALTAGFWLWAIPALARAAVALLTHS